MKEPNKKKEKHTCVMVKYGTTGYEYHKCKCGRVEMIKNNKGIYLNR